MRTFIAIDLPQEVKDFLKTLQDKLKESKADVKWVSPQNIHLTLKFLGEIDEEKVPRIIQIMEDAVKDKAPFCVSLSTVGAFPKITSPRIIWAGITEGDGPVKEIVKTLEKKLEHLGIPSEKRAFSSHITIGRTRSGLNQDLLAEKLNESQGLFKNKSLKWDITAITLFKSTLTPKGPIYEALKETNLRTT